MISKHQSFLPISNLKFLPLYVAPHNMRTLLPDSCGCISAFCTRRFILGNKQETYFYVCHIYEFLQNNRSLRNQDTGNILPTKGRNSSISDSPWAMKFSVEIGPRVRRFRYFLELMPKSFINSSLQLGMTQRLSKAGQMVFQIEEDRKGWKEHILEQ